MVKKSGAACPAGLGYADHAGTTGKSASRRRGKTSVSASRQGYEKRGRANLPAPGVRLKSGPQNPKGSAAEQERVPLSGDLLHSEGLNDVACPGKAGFSGLHPGGHNPRRAKPACGKGFGSRRTLGPAGAGRRAAAPEGDGKKDAVSRVYLGISSIVKASMMSPSLMSLNFSTVRPHS